MICDYRLPYFEKIRFSLNSVTVPIQKAVDFPIRTVQALRANVVAQQYLVNENAKLRAHQLLLESKLQRLLALERENIQLRDLLKSTPEVSGQVIVAQLLAISLDPALNQVVIDKGQRDEVYEGQPVLDAFGVMGQIVNVGPTTSRAMLVTDERSAVPVKSLRNGIRGIVVGLGQPGVLSLINMLNTSDIKVGDLFVSSGMGLRFPVGYPVGVVTKVDYSPGQRFSTILLTPSAHLDRSTQVLLAWPDKATLYETVKEQMESPLPGQKIDAPPQKKDAG